MKSWLTKSELTKLEQTLKAAPAAPEPPALLHESIMWAVRRSQHHAPARSKRLLAMPWWLPAPVVGALALAAVWWLAHEPRQTPSREARTVAQAGAAVSTAFELADEMTHTMPSAAVAPLSEEWERISRDLESTTQFFLASVP